MNWKRVIALGLLGLTFGMGQSYAIDVNIPGADASIPGDEYQNYRKNTSQSRQMDQRIVEKVTRDNKSIPNYDMSKTPMDIYHTRELNHGVRYSSTVFILKENGANIKFTIPQSSIVAQAKGSMGKHKELISAGGVMTYNGEWYYELRPQPKGDNWEDTNIPYSKLNSDAMKEVFYKRYNPIAGNKKISEKVLGANTFTYPTVEKATWDSIVYKNDLVEGTINFTMPKQPTISYHIGYMLPKGVVKKISAKGDDTLVKATMNGLANIVLPSVKPASDILEYTSEVHRGPFTFRILKNSKSLGTKITKNGSQVEYFKSGKIKESISVRPLFKRDDPKKQNIMNHSLIGFVGADRLNEGKSIQFATVWNDALPGAYYEVKGEKDTLFVMTVFDDTHLYTHYMVKPHDVHVSNFKLRDIVQYVDYKHNKEDYGRFKLGLGMPKFLIERNISEQLNKKK